MYVCRSSVRNGVTGLDWSGAPIQSIKSRPIWIGVH